MPAPVRRRAKALSGRMLALSKGTRRRAIRWILRLETDELTNIHDALEMSFRDYVGPTGAGTFKDLRRVATDRGDLRGLIGNLRDEKPGPAVPALAEIVAGGFGSASTAAARALGAIGPSARAAVPALEKAAASFHLDLADAAREALEAVRS